MSKLKYLNVGCGNKVQEDWINVDMSSPDPRVKIHNLLKGIPYPDDYFEVIYHSQVLEHFYKDAAPNFIKECFRVLKKGGIMRVVVPDLENLVSEYIKYLHLSLENPDNKEYEANYDWITLEMYDQTVRNKSGGQMNEFLKNPNIINSSFIENRIGYIDKTLRNKYMSFQPDNSLLKRIIRKIKKEIGIIKDKFSSENAKAGRFRSSGEIHYWMYDRYSLSRLLKNAGFRDIQVKTPFDSNIPEWGKYELDVKDGHVFDPSSLFIEATK